MKLFRNLSLILKVTVTLTAVFLVILLVFFFILFPFQEQQIQNLFDLKKDFLKRLVLWDYQRLFIRDLLDENDESLGLHLRKMDEEKGFEAVTLFDPQSALVATTDPVKVYDVLDRVKGREGGKVEEETEGPPLLIFRQGHSLRITSAEGESILPIPDKEVIRQSPEAFLPPGFLEEPEGFQERTWQGRRVLTYTVKLRALEDSFGTLRVEYSLEDLVHNERMTRAILYGLIGFFLLLLFLLNLLILRIVIRPVRDLYRAMHRAGKGDLGVTLPVTSKDEIGEMSHSFNQMARNLKALKEEIEDYSRNLEIKVEERTRELRLSEANLLNLKNYLATVINNVGAGVISLDESGRITTFNERASRLLGIEASGAETLLLKDVLRAGDLPLLAELASSVQVPGSPPLRKELALRFHGRRIHLSVSATPLQREGKEKPGVILVFDDVTQIVYSEKLLGWKEAVEKVIHEIKNPITPIRLSAQQILTAFSDKSKDFETIFSRGMQNIVSSLDTLYVLVSHFSQFYRTPKIELRTEDINDLVSKTLSLYLGGLPEGIRLVSRLDKKIPPIQVDREQVKRVLVNVIQNALESMSERSGIIEVSTSLKKGGEMVALSVKDQGRGMRPDEMEKIFEPYYTTKIKGTGLGLIITRQIVEEHGGELIIESEPEKGTTVDILLPADGK